MNKYDKISTIFWFLVGLYVIREGYVIHLGKLREPGPGFLLFWSGIILCGLSAFTFIKAVSAQEKDSKKMWEGIEWHKPLLVLIISFTYAFFFMKIGFLISTFLLMLFLFKFSKYQKWPMAVGASLLSTIVSWVIFDFCLKTQFPKGFLENLFISTLKLRY